MADDLSPEERAWRRRWLEEHEEPPGPFGPVHDPPAFRHLPAHVRSMIAGLSKTEADNLGALARIDPTKLASLIEDYSAAQTIGRFGKWLALTVAAFFVGSMAFGKQVVELIGSLKGLSK